MPRKKCPSCKLDLITQDDKQRNLCGPCSRRGSPTPPPPTTRKPTSPTTPPMKASSSWVDAFLTTVPPPLDEEEEVHANGNHEVDPPPVNPCKDIVVEEGSDTIPDYLPAADGSLTPTGRELFRRKYGRTDDKTGQMESTTSAIRRVVDHITILSEQAAIITESPTMPQEATQPQGGQSPTQTTPSAVVSATGAATIGLAARLKKQVVEVVPTVM